MSENPDEIKFGDHIIVYVDPKTIKCVALVDKQYLDTKFGRYYHDQFDSRKYGIIVLTNAQKATSRFKLELEFYTLMLAYCTQFLYLDDISFAIYNLGATKISKVYELGRLIKIQQLADNVLTGNHDGRHGRHCHVQVQRVKAEKHGAHI